MFPVGLMGVETLTVVDTAADTTVISQELFETLPMECWVGIGEEVVLHNVGMQSAMSRWVLSNVILRVGQKSYACKVTVAPIADLLRALR